MRAKTPARIWARLISKFSRGVRGQTCEAAGASYQNQKGLRPVRDGPSFAWEMAAAPCGAGCFFRGRADLLFVINAQWTE